MAASSPTPLEKALRHDRAVIIGALVVACAVAWGYMVFEARRMGHTGVCACFGLAMSGPSVDPWSLASVFPLFLMWAEMMVAMMIPSAAPMILTFAQVNRQRELQQRPFVRTSFFVLGYLMIWTAFSFAAAIAQWALHGAALLSPEMKSTSPWIGGVLLIGAGAFQWTPWKGACLNHCRSPLSFLLTEWRDGERGAILMGLRHGLYCTGCCWLLMALLFVAGVMNMVWVAVITILVLLEKAVLQPLRIRIVSGVLLVAWGIWVLASR